MPLFLFQGDREIESFARAVLKTYEETTGSITRLFAVVWDAHQRSIVQTPFLDTSDRTTIENWAEADASPESIYSAKGWLLSKLMDMSRDGLNELARLPGVGKKAKLILSFRTAHGNIPVGTLGRLLHVDTTYSLVTRDVLGLRCGVLTRSNASPPGMRFLFLPDDPIGVPEGEPAYPFYVPHESVEIIPEPATEHWTLAQVDDLWETRSDLGLGLLEVTTPIDQVVWANSRDGRYAGMVPAQSLPRYVGNFDRNVLYFRNEIVRHPFRMTHRFYRVDAWSSFFQIPPEDGDDIWSRAVLGYEETVEQMVARLRTGGSPPRPPARRTTAPAHVTNTTRTNRRPVQPVNRVQQEAEQIIGTLGDGTPVVPQSGGTILDNTLRPSEQSRTPDSGTDRAGEGFLPMSRNSVFQSFRDHVRSRRAIRYRGRFTPNTYYARNDVVAVGDLLVVAIRDIFVRDWVHNGDFAILRNFVTRQTLDTLQTLMSNNQTVSEILPEGVPRTLTRYKVEHYRRNESPEAQAGMTYRYRGLYNAEFPYQKGDVILLQNDVIPYFVCIAPIRNRTQSPHQAPQCWVPVPYFAQDMDYLCQVLSRERIIQPDPQAMTVSNVIGNHDRRYIYRADWVRDRYYVPGNVVVYQNKLYLCHDHTGSSMNPEKEIQSWVLLQELRPEDTPRVIARELLQNPDYTPPSPVNRFPTGTPRLVASDVQPDVWYPLRVKKHTVIRSWAEDAWYIALAELQVLDRDPSQLPTFAKIRMPSAMLGRLVNDPFLTARVLEDVEGRRRPNRYPELHFRGEWEAAMPYAPGNVVSVATGEGAPPHHFICIEETTADIGSPIDSDVSTWVYWSPLDLPDSVDTTLGPQEMIGNINRDADVLEAVWMSAVSTHVASLDVPQTTLIRTIARDNLSSSSHHLTLKILSRVFSQLPRTIQQRVNEILPSEAEILGIEGFEEFVSTIRPELGETIILHLPLIRMLERRLATIQGTTLSAVFEREEAIETTVIEMTRAIASEVTISFPYPNPDASAIQPEFLELGALIYWLRIRDEDLSTAPRSNYGTLSFPAQDESYYGTLRTVHWDRGSGGRTLTNTLYAVSVPTGGPYTISGAGIPEGLTLRAQDTEYMNMRNYLNQRVTSALRLPDAFFNFPTNRPADLYTFTDPHSEPSEELSGTLPIGVSQEELVRLAQTLEHVGQSTEEFQAQLDSLVGQLIASTNQTVMEQSESAPLPRFIRSHPSEWPIFPFYLGDAEPFREAAVEPWMVSALSQFGIRYPEVSAESNLARALSAQDASYAMETFRERERQAEYLVAVMNAFPAQVQYTMVTPQNRPQENPFQEAIPLFDARSYLRTAQGLRATADPVLEYRGIWSPEGYYTPGAVVRCVQGYRSAEGQRQMFYYSSFYLRTSDFGMGSSPWMGTGWVMLDVCLPVPAMYHDRLREMAPGEEFTWSMLTHRERCYQQVNVYATTTFNPETPLLFPGQYATWEQYRSFCLPVLLLDRDTQDLADADQLIRMGNYLPRRLAESFPGYSLFCEHDVLRQAEGQSFAPAIYLPIREFGVQPVQPGTVVRVENQHYLCLDLTLRPPTAESRAWAPVEIITHEQAETPLRFIFGSFMRDQLEFLRIRPAMFPETHRMIVQDPMTLQAWHSEQYPFRPQSQDQNQTWIWAESQRTLSAMEAQISARVSEGGFAPCVLFYEDTGETFGRSYLRAGDIVEQAGWFWFVQQDAPPPFQAQVSANGESVYPEVDAAYTPVAEGFLPRSTFHDRTVTISNPSQEAQSLLAERTTDGFRLPLVENLGLGNTPLHSWTLDQVNQHSILLVRGMGRWARGTIYRPGDIVSGNRAGYLYLATMIPNPLLLPWENPEAWEPLAPQDMDLQFSDETRRWQTVHVTPRVYSRIMRYLQGLQPPTENPIP